MSEEELKTDEAVVSDIAVHHVEGFYSSATRTWASLVDLVELCQAAVLYDSLMVSPVAYEHSTLLQQLDCVGTMRPQDSEPSAESREDEPAPNRVLQIDTDERLGIVGRSYLAQVFVTMAVGEEMQRDPVMGGLFNPRQLPQETDRGRYFLSQLPFFMTLLQVQKGVLQFEDDEAKDAAAQFCTRVREPYRKYAGGLLRLQQRHGAGLVNSSIESPLLDAQRIDAAAEVVERDETFRQVLTEVERAIKGPPARARHFEQWVLPPLGLMVVGQATTLDDIPHAITQARDKFAKLRRTIWQLERRRIEAEQAGEQDWRQLDHLNQELQAGYTAFHEEVARGRTSPALQRQATFFNLPKLVGSILSGGLGIAIELVERLMPERWGRLGLVPGLYSAASFVKSTDDVGPREVAERYLGRVATARGMQRMLLSTSMWQSESYAAAKVADSDEEDARIEFNRHDGGEPTSIPLSRFWHMLAVDERSRNHCLFGDPFK